MSARRALNGLRAPNERGAEERAWAVVRSAYRDHPVAAPARSRWRLALVPALIVLIGAVALSPAGANVSHLIRQALGIPGATRALSSLPAPGRLLVSDSAGTWMVAADGSTRRLGYFGDAGWSPHGLYVAIAQRDRLIALNPRGVVQWTLQRRDVGDPRWYSPTGYRVAYLSDRQLRVVAGDGTEDHLLATGVAPGAPAWRPDHPYQLAYLTAHGELLVRNADTGSVVWTARAGPVQTLAWSADGSRLLAAGAARVRIYDPAGRPIASTTLSPAGPVMDAALSSDGRTLAVVQGGDHEEVAIANTNHTTLALLPVLSGRGLGQVIFSPDGRWLLVSWPAADQWVFVRLAGRPRIAAVSRIAERFGGSSASAFPTLDGWCCTASARRADP